MRQEEPALLPSLILLPLVAGIFPIKVCGISHPVVVEELEGNLSDAFLVQVNGCSGSVIADSWVVSAAHCFQEIFNYRFARARTVTNRFGDTELDLVLGERRLWHLTVTKPMGWATNSIRNVSSWTSSLPLPYFTPPTAAVYGTIRQMP